MNPFFVFDTVNTMFQPIHFIAFLRGTDSMKREDLFLYGHIMISVYTIFFFLFYTARKTTHLQTVHLKKAVEQISTKL